MSPGQARRQESVACKPCILGAGGVASGSPRQVGPPPAIWRMIVRLPPRVQRPVSDCSAQPGQTDVPGGAWNARGPCRSAVAPPIRCTGATPHTRCDAAGCPPPYTPPHTPPHAPPPRVLLPPLHSLRAVVRPAWRGVMHIRVARRLRAFGKPGSEQLGLRRSELQIRNKQRNASEIATRWKWSASAAAVRRQEPWDTCDGCPNRPAPAAPAVQRQSRGGSRRPGRHAPSAVVVMWREPSGRRSSGPRAASRLRCTMYIQYSTLTRR